MHRAWVNGRSLPLFFVLPCESCSAARAADGGHFLVQVIERSAHCSCTRRAVGGISSGETWLGAKDKNKSSNAALFRNRSVDNRVCNTGNSHHHHILLSVYHIHYVSIVPTAALFVARAKETSSYLVHHMNHQNQNMSNINNDEEEDIVVARDLPTLYAVWFIR